MLRKSLDNVPLPGKVLHELARKFDGVPFNAADARDGDLCLIREEMVEAVAEFVEERRHVVMRERGGAAVDALGKVADEIGDRRLQDAVHDAARAVGVYFNKQRKKWIAQIMFRGKCHYLGGFDDFDEAVEARKQGEEMFLDVLRAHQGEKQSQAEK